MSQPLFWADKLADEIITRKNFRYQKKNIPEITPLTVKTSASISGVLHIGRLSDTIRSEAVFRALTDRNIPARLIWVAEDMDPLRSIPKNVPNSFAEYLGMPVTDIPDPDGNFKSYAARHLDAYFKVIDEFVVSDMEKFSMRAEYQKGKFKSYIQKAIAHQTAIIEILNKFRRKPLKDWSPWQPICDNCGKIITPRVTGIESGKVAYECKDYQFEKGLAKGCGHIGVNDPAKGNGKLAWKSEWAMQWAHWGVVSEGAGKEYQVPGSAFWINSEIVEKIFNFPSPVPIFYEHIMIDGKKMSASVGNVVYPADWLKVAPPDLLRFFYLKKLMKTRSFSFADLPALFNEYDRLRNIRYGHTPSESEKEREHARRMYELSAITDRKTSISLPFDFLGLISQITQNKTEILSILKRTGHVEKTTRDDENEIMERLNYARNWIQKYKPEDAFSFRKINAKAKNIPEPDKQAWKYVGEKLKENSDPHSIKKLIKTSIDKYNISTSSFFTSGYKIFIGKEKGPKMVTLLMAAGIPFTKERLAAL